MRTILIFVLMIPEKSIQKLGKRNVKEVPMGKKNLGQCSTGNG